jgi:hypothetical protein
VAVLTAGAAPAAATPVGGEITRAGDTVVRVPLTNTGSSDDIGVAVEFHPPVTVASATRISGPPGNCAPDGGQPNRVLCLLDPPGLAPGASIVIDVNTNPRLEDNAGANAFSCGIPCNTSMMSGPYALSGPAPAGPAADLGVEFRVDRQFRGERFDEFQVYDLLPPRSRDRRWVLLVNVLMTNHGPATAENPALSVTGSAPPGTDIESVRHRVMPLGALSGGCRLITGARALPSALCSYDAIGRGGTAALVYPMMFRNLGAFSLDATVSSTTSDPGPNPNTATLADEIVRAPLSRSVRVRRSTIRGEATGASKVLLGIAREEGGAKLGSASTGSTASSAVPAATGCRWLVSKRLRFRREAGRRCDDPSYIEARVRRGRWSVRLARRLPPGRYAALVQAVSRDGLVETGLSARLQNFKRFRVR